MGLFDALGLTSKPDVEAAQNKNLAALYGYQATAGGQLADYGAQARGDISSGVAKAAGAIGTGTEQAAGALGSAIGAYNPLAALGSQYGGAVNAYYDALGLGGQAGKDRALANFQQGPGYDWLQSEASKGIINNASRFGAGGGNTLTALQDRAGQIANQAWYQNYLQPLAAFPGLATQATQGAAAGQAQGYGQLGSLYADTGKTLGGLYTTEGSDLANVGGNVLQGQLGIGGNVLTGTQAANNAVASAAAQDAAAKWGAINAGIGALGSAFKPPSPYGAVPYTPR